MNTSSEIWIAFARTFSLLLLVLAIVILAFYLIKKFSASRGVKGGKDFIKVLCVHHLSPKEKLVLVNVMGDTILIGVTPASISKISSLETDMTILNQEEKPSSGFSQFLAQKLGGSFKNKANSFLEKEDRQ